MTDVLLLIDSQVLGDERWLIVQPHVLKADLPAYFGTGPKRWALAHEQSGDYVPVPLPKNTRLAVDFTHAVSPDFVSEPLTEEAWQQWRALIGSDEVPPAERVDRLRAFYGRDKTSALELFARRAPVPLQESREVFATVERNSDDVVLADARAYAVANGMKEPPPAMNGGFTTTLHDQLGPHLARTDLDQLLKLALWGGGRRYAPEGTLRTEKPLLRHQGDAVSLHSLLGLTILAPRQLRRGDGFVVSVGDQPVGQRAFTAAHFVSSLLDTPVVASPSAKLTVVEPKTALSALRRFTPFPPWDGLSGFFRGPLVTARRFVQHDPKSVNDGEPQWQAVTDVEPVLAWECDVGQFGGYASADAALLIARSKDGDEAQRAAIRAALEEVVAGKASLELEPAAGKAEAELVGVYRFAWEADPVVLLRWTKSMASVRPARAVCWMRRAGDQLFNALRAPTKDPTAVLGVHVRGDYEFRLDHSYLRRKATVCVREPTNAGGTSYGSLLIRSDGEEFNRWSRLPGTTPDVPDPPWLFSFLVPNEPPEPRGLSDRARTRDYFKHVTKGSKLSFEVENRFGHRVPVEGTLERSHVLDLPLLLPTEVRPLEEQVPLARARNLPPTGDARQRLDPWEATLGRHREGAPLLSLEYRVGPFPLRERLVARVRKELLTKWQRASATALRTLADLAEAEQIVLALEWRRFHWAAWGGKQLSVADALVTVGSASFGLEKFFADVWDELDDPTKPAELPLDLAALQLTDDQQLWQRAHALKATLTVVRKPGVKLTGAPLRSDLPDDERKEAEAALLSWEKSLREQRRTGPVPPSFETAPDMARSLRLTERLQQSDHPTQRRENLWWIAPPGLASRSQGTTEVIEQLAWTPRPLFNSTLRQHSDAALLAVFGALQLALDGAGDLLPSTLDEAKTLAKTLSTGWSSLATAAARLLRSPGRADDAFGARVQAWYAEVLRRRPSTLVSSSAVLTTQVKDALVPDDVFGLEVTRSAIKRAATRPDEKRIETVRFTALERLRPTALEFAEALPANLYPPGLPIDSAIVVEGVERFLEPGNDHSPRARKDVKATFSIPPRAPPPKLALVKQKARPASGGTYTLESELEFDLEAEVEVFSISSPLRELEPLARDPIVDADQVARGPAPLVKVLLGLVLEPLANRHRGDERKKALTSVLERLADVEQVLFASPTLLAGGTAVVNNRLLEPSQELTLSGDLSRLEKLELFTELAATPRQLTLPSPRAAEYKFKLDPATGWQRVVASFGKEVEAIEWNVICATAPRSLFKGKVTSDQGAVRKRNSEQLPSSKTNTAPPPPVMVRLVVEQACEVWSTQRLVVRQASRDAQGSPVYVASGNFLRIGELTTPTTPRLGTNATVDALYRALAKDLSPLPSASQAAQLKLTLSLAEKLETELGLSSKFPVGAWEGHYRGGQATPTFAQATAILWRPGTYLAELRWRTPENVDFAWLVKEVTVS